MSQSSTRSPTSLPLDKLMLDLIFVVSDTKTWHQENLKLNPNHYSFLRILGPAGLTFLQRNVKANIYFNVVLDSKTENSKGETSPLLSKKSKSKVKGSNGKNGKTIVTLMKYGVIQLEDLMVDLKEWICLYVAGRLHKPVQPLIPPPDPLERLLVRNRISALASSIFFLPQEFSEMELFVTVAGLSYMGDFRMIVGEDKSKVVNIVTPQLPAMRELYHQLLLNHVLLDEGHVTFDRERRRYRVRLSRQLLFHLVSCLPSYVLDSMGGFEEYCLTPFVTSITSRGSCQSDVTSSRQQGNFGKLDEDKDLLNLKLKISHDLKATLSSIVWRSSLSQGVKGFFSTGFLKAIKYIRRKMTKMFLSLQVHNGNTATAVTEMSGNIDGTQVTSPKSVKSLTSKKTIDDSLINTSLDYVYSWWTIVTSFTTPTPAGRDVGGTR